MPEEGKTWGMRHLRRLSWIGGITSLFLILTAIAIAVIPPVGEFLGRDSGDPGVAFATAGLAIFTGLLFFAAAVAAGIAREEISAATHVNSANLALQMDNRFHSDRVLRIRHGAAAFLAKHQKDSNGKPKRDLNLSCYHNISPYGIDQQLWYGLTSDLIDIFNYYDWIGYLAHKRPKSIDQEVVAQKFGPWIINYYQICEVELGAVRADFPRRWRYLSTLYNILIQRERDLHERENPGEPYNGRRSPEQIDDFLRREHVRSHRGFALGSHDSPTTPIPS
jgi:hypothetical protein